MEINGSRLWSTQEVADYLGIPVQTLYRWRSEGTGPPGYRLGKHVRFEPSAVRAWLNQHADQR